MPDKPTSQDVPSYEDIEKELGLDAMSFMSGMLKQKPQEDEES